LQTDNRVALFLMDYPRQARLKILGRARLAELGEEPALIAKLALPDYAAKVERGIVIHIEGFDWNCPQHITPRFTLADINEAVQPLRNRIAELESELAQLKSRGS
jgi:predicted pyridoxine 5'-phosphate oxidase superfamily flavin-nucleotide-binding protein